MLPACSIGVLRQFCSLSPPWPWHWPCHCVWPTGWKRTWTKSLPTRADTALPLGIFLPPQEQPCSRWLNDKKHVTLTSVMTQSTASNHSHSNLVWTWLGAIKLLHWAQVRTVTRINGGHFKPLYLGYLLKRLKVGLGVLSDGSNQSSAYRESLRA